MKEEALISISEASAMLGVSEAALRLWTDEGLIKAFITPGGHRRYSRHDLKKFMGSNNKLLGMKDLINEIEDTAQTHRDIARASVNDAPWYSRMDGKSREKLAGLGRELLHLVIEYLTEHAKREAIIKSAREIGSSFGNLLSMSGLPLTDSVEAFLMHRNAITIAASDMMKKKERFTGRVIDAIPLAGRVMDQALLSLVSAHQAYQLSSQDEPKKDDQGTHLS